MSQPPHWSRPGDLVHKLEKLWDKGDILTRALDPLPQPWIMPLRGPSSSSLVEYFDAARQWVQEWLHTLDQKPYQGSQLVWQTINHRQLGTNQIPKALEIPSPKSAAAILHRTAQLQKFLELSEKILQRFPTLEPWIKRKPQEVLTHQAHWDQILDSLSWLQTHPQSGLYLRQIDLPGVHTKFLESRKTLLRELAQYIMTPGRDNEADFHAQFGFKTKPTLVRFRFLDPAQGPSLGHFRPQELTLRSEDFGLLNPDVDQVLILENEVTWLALPKKDRTLAIFGSGYGWAHIQAALPWLRTKAIYYWGDLDTHGFAILDQLRSHLPQTLSLLMDVETLQAHRSLWTQEPTPHKRQLPRLTPDEQSLYQDLISQTFSPGLRLEQERLDYQWVLNHLSRLTPPRP